MNDYIKVADVLNGARMVEVCPEMGVMVIWYGGHSLFNVYQLHDWEICSDSWTQKCSDAQEAQAIARAWLDGDHIE